MERSKPNPNYRSVRYEYYVLDLEFGGYAMREYRRRGNRIYLRGKTDSGVVIISTLSNVADGEHGAK